MNLRFFCKLLIVPFHLALPLVSTAPVVGRLGHFNAVACSSSDSPECSCATTPQTGCEVCCSVEENKVECSSVCALDAMQLRTIKYEVLAKQAADEFKKLYLNATVQSSETNVSRATSNVTNVQLPVTWIEGGGEGFDHLFIKLLIGRALVPRSCSGDIAEEEPMLSTSEPPEKDDFPVECRSPEEQYQLEQETRARLVVVCLIHVF